MVIDGRATLSIKSLTHRAADVTGILGIEPSAIGEKGEPYGRSREKPDGSVSRRKRSYSSWVLDAPDPDPDDETGFSSVENLVSILQQKVDQLELLRENYYVEIWWNGFSNSARAGFLLPAELLAALGALGCDFHGTLTLEQQQQLRAEAEPEVEAETDAAADPSGSAGESAMNRAENSPTG